MTTRRSPPGTAIGLNITALTSVKTIVLSPMPSASVSTTAAENQRCVRIMRSAKRKSCVMEVKTRFLAKCFIGLRYLDSAGTHSDPDSLLTFFPVERLWEEVDYEIWPPKTNGRAMGRCFKGLSTY